MSAKTIVVKYGGHAMDVPGLREAFFKNLLAMRAMDMSFVLVHGGGPQINDLLCRLNIESSFVDGLRVTDDKTLEAVEMALCGKVNKALVRMLLAAGMDAAGICGEDARLFAAKQKDPRLGRVGEIVQVNPGIVACLLQAGFLPVVAPLAIDDDCRPLNVNADTAAGALAGALKADYFILVSDVPGVLDNEGRLFSYLAEDAIMDLRKAQIIKGGMIPKVEACLEALRRGCAHALILDGKQENSLLDCLGGKSIKGTEIAL